MADISFTLEAKSDQLNAIDIMDCDRIIKVTKVDVTKGDQPVSVFFYGDNGRPWKPSKGMRRILSGAWGKESDNWIGKHAELYFDPSVKFGGKEVGGIRVKALSDIPNSGLQFSLAISRTKREPYHVPLLVVKVEDYPQDRFDKALPAMAKKMHEGEMTLQQVIAQCQKTGNLTETQLSALQQAAPVEIDDNDEEVM